MKQRSTYLKNLLVSATSVMCISKPVALLTALFSVFLHLVGATEIGNRDLVLRIACAAISVAPAFVVIWVFQKLVNTGGFARVALMFTSFFIGGFFRSLTLPTLLDAFAIPNRLALPGRLFTNSLLMTIAIALCTHLATNFHIQRLTLRNLQNETLHLNEVLQQLENERKGASLSQVNKVVKQIVDELTQLTFVPREKQILQIQTILNSQVRPLSKSHAAELETWKLRDYSVRDAPLRGRFSNLDISSSLPSPWIAIIICATGSGTAFALFGFLPALKAISFSALTVVPLLYMAFALFKKLEPKMHGYGKYLVFFILTAIASFAAAYASYFGLAETNDPYFFVIIGFFSFAALIVSVTLASAVSNDFRTQTRNLRAVHAELEWAIARANLLAWYNRGEIARMLHGPIQNSLHATLIRLKHSKPEAIVDTVIQELRDRITLSANSLSASTINARKVHETLDAMVDLWAGIANIKYSVDERTVLTLQQDFAAAAIIFDLCNEVCSNAIRHGKATEVTISICTGDRVVIVDIVNNSFSQNEKGPSGLGSMLLESCSITWNSQSTKAGQKLNVSLPCTWNI